MVELSIKFDRNSIVFRLVCGCVMLLIGIWLIFGKADCLNFIPKFNDPNLKKFFGYLIVLLMTIGNIFLLNCLFTKKPAFEIDQDGFCTKASMFNRNKVYWKNIESIEDTTINFFFVNMTAVKVVQKIGKSPILLSAGLLKITQAELSKELKDSFEKYRKLNFG